MSESGTPNAVDAARWAPRLQASLIDYLVIVGWLLVLTVLGFVIRPFLPAQTGPPNLVATDVLAFCVSVLPVWLYLTLTESADAAATIGKRIKGLTVTLDLDGRASWTRIALRNAIKLLPWQLAHVAVSRFIYGVEFAVAITAYSASLLIVVVTLVMVVVDPKRRALHDRLAGTRVVKATPC